MFLATNLKFLRKRRKRTQDEVAFALEIKRATLNGYENGIGEPKLERLLAIAAYYRFSIDDLLQRDLSKLPESKLQALEVTPLKMTG